MQKGSMGKVTQPMEKTLETPPSLSRIVLLYIAIQFFPGSHILIRVPTRSDNTTAEAVSHKLFSTQMPMAHCSFPWETKMLISSSHMEVDVSHIPGHANDYADALSRWNGDGIPPHHFLLHDRFPLTLQQLWHPEMHPTLFPANTSLPWQLPR